MAEPLGALGMVTQLLGSLPMLLMLSQLVAYVFMIVFFGGIAVKGFRKHLSFFSKFALAIPIGLLCLIGGIALSNFIAIPGLSSGIMKLLQLDLLIGGVVSAAVFAAALYMMTRRMSKVEGEVHRRLKLLESEISRMRKILQKRKIFPNEIPEEAAIRRASKALKGFSAESAAMKDEKWHVLMKKGRKRAKVVLDPYTGHVDEIVSASVLVRAFSDPLRIAGIALFLVFMVFSLANFTGFPNFATDLFSSLGMPFGGEGGLSGLGSLGGEIPFLGQGSVSPGECVSAFTLFQEASSDLMKGILPKYTDLRLKDKIEQGSGKNVVEMYSVSYGGGDYVIALMLPPGVDIASEQEVKENTDICSATTEKFCECLRG